jgi:hypothetical protein
MMIASRLILLYALIFPQASADLIEINLAPTNLSQTNSRSRLYINLPSSTPFETPVCGGRSNTTTAPGGEFDINLTSGLTQDESADNEIQFSFQIPEGKQVFVKADEIVQIRFFANNLNANPQSCDEDSVSRSGNKITSSDPNVEVLESSDITLNECGIEVTLNFKACRSLTGNYSFTTSYPRDDSALLQGTQTLRFDYCNSFLTYVSRSPVLYGSCNRQSRRKLQDGGVCVFCDALSSRDVLSSPTESPTAMPSMQTSSASITRGLVAGSVTYLLALAMF